LSKNIYITNLKYNIIKFSDYKIDNNILKLNKTLQLVKKMKKADNLIDIVIISFNYKNRQYYIDFLVMKGSIFCTFKNLFVDSDKLDNYSPMPWANVINSLNIR
jgi:hypothetical protein